MINSVVIQGRLARDPEIKTTQSGIAVANFTVCWSDKYKETETRLFLPARRGAARRSAGARGAASQRSP